MSKYLNTANDDDDDDDDNSGNPNDSLTGSTRTNQQAVADIKDDNNKMREWINPDWQSAHGLIRGSWKIQKIEKQPPCIWTRKSCKDQKRIWTNTHTQWMKRKNTRFYSTTKADTAAVAVQQQQPPLLLLLGKTNTRQWQKVRPGTERKKQNAKPGEEKQTLLQQ